MSKEYKEVSKAKIEEAKKIMTSEQWKKCHTAIHTAAAASLAAGALPIPTVDAIPITAAQLAMVTVLGNAFGKTMSDSAKKGIISAAAATMIGRSVVKFIPIIGWGISGFVAAGITEAVGWSIAVDFAKEAKLYNRATSNNGSKSILNNKKEDSTQQTLDSLKSRATPFLSGERSKSTNQKEYDLLIHDFEKVLDSIPEHDPLRDIYDKLCLIF